MLGKSYLAVYARQPTAASMQSQRYCRGVKPVVEAGAGSTAVWFEVAIVVVIGAGLGSCIKLRKMLQRGGPMSRQEWSERKRLQH